MTLLTTIERRYGIDRLTLGLFAGSFLLYLGAWWLRETTISFNGTVFQIGGGVMLVNGIMTTLFARREPFLGYLFGGAALLYQLFLVVLLTMAARGILG